MRPSKSYRCLIVIGALALCCGPVPASAQFLRPKKTRRVVTPQPRQPSHHRHPGRTTEARPKAHSPHVGDSVESGLALQLALERAWFSPGILDGKVGPKTRAALGAFQTSRGLTPTGRLDEETQQRLKLDTIQPTREYTLTKADASRVGPCPTDWIERSEAERMPFRSLVEVVAFEGHCTHQLIARLNPDVDIHRLELGQTIRLPNVLKPGRIPKIDTIEVDFANKRIRAHDAEGNVVALFNCSIARRRDDRPEGDCKVRAIAVNPIYTFRPESWPEVKGIDHALRVPPGPRNPVGLCWIDLTIDGYGIHGTPDPEMIGKTGSHGCIRMTNWDVLRLSKAVRPGMKVILNQGDRQVADGNVH